MFCSLVKGITLKSCMLCFVLINSILLNLLCVWIWSVEPFIRGSLTWMYIAMGMEKFQKRLCGLFFSCFLQRGGLLSELHCAKKIINLSFCRKRQHSWRSRHNRSSHFSSTGQWMPLTSLSTPPKLSSAQVPVDGKCNCKTSGLWSVRITGFVHPTISFVQETWSHRLWELGGGGGNFKSVIEFTLKLSI